jgi:hypothetical protein
MGADRIEIAEDSSMERRAGMGLVADDILVDTLGVAIGREGLLARRRLIDGQVLGIGLAIDGAGGREDEMTDVVLLHESEERDERERIVAIVEQRTLHGLTHRLGSREMDHAYDIGMGTEDGVHRYIVAAIGIDKVGTAAYDGLDAIQDLDIGVGEVIDDDNIVALLHEFYDGMRTDIPYSAGDENSIHSFQYSAFSIQFSE